MKLILSTYTLVYMKSNVVWEIVISYIITVLYQQLLPNMASQLEKKILVSSIVEVSMNKIAL